MGNPTFWAGCEECSHFDNGVQEIAFKVAEFLVISEGYKHYSYMNPEDYSESYYIKTQIRGTSSFVSRIINIYESMRGSNDR